MTPPLVKHLQYDGMADFGNDILLGQAADIPHIDNNTKIHLQELSALICSLPNQAQPTTLGEYTIEVSWLREGTSSGPSDVTPVMVKTEVLDSELAEIGWRRFNFPWCTRYLPKRYQRGLDLLINKDSNNYRPHRLWPILLLDIWANIHNKHLGRIARRQAETLESIAPEQYGRRKEKSADTQALNTRLFYDSNPKKNYQQVFLLI